MTAVTVWPLASVDHVSTAKQLLKSRPEEPIIKAWMSMTRTQTKPMSLSRSWTSVNEHKDVNKLQKQLFPSTLLMEDLFSIFTKKWLS